MKFLLSLIALCAIQASYAQKIITESYPSNKVNEIRVDAKYADIEIETHSEKEIIIEASININLNLDNEAYSLITSNNRGVFTITSEIDHENIPKRLILKDKEGNTEVILNNDKNLENMEDLRNNYHSINYGSQTDITLKIKLPENKNLTIKSIYGDLVASGKYADVKAKITYGDIEMKQSNVSNAATIELYSIYGFVDYSVPKSANIEFNLSTSYGEILTDLDVTSTLKNVFVGNQCNTGRGGKYTLNEGKAVANITATYDDIYLRGN